MWIYFTGSPKIKKSTNQNSGVHIDATNNNVQKYPYYGYIEEIWKLEYGPSFKVLDVGITLRVLDIPLPRLTQ
jgi:hypothetical protein